VAEELARHYRVLILDLPGFGQSSELDAGDPDIFIDAISDFLSAVVWEPAVIVAAGLSAAYTAAVAAEGSDRVRALAWVTPLGLGADAGPGSPSEHGVRSFLLSIPGLRATVLDTLTSRVALERFLRSEVYSAPERVDAAILDHHYRASHQSSCRHGLIAWLRGRLAYDPTADLARITQPVWICWGRDTRHPPVEDADLWLHHVSGAELEVLPGAGALPHAEQPAAFARALERFVASLPALPAPPT
jgi:pyruvate dehydrogenase E2 component (dihydrolipoamide acetyltransferase)